jgi:hypothetical protein
MEQDYNHFWIIMRVFVTFRSFSGHGIREKAFADRKTGFACFFHLMLSKGQTRHETGAQSPGSARRMCTEGQAAEILVWRFLFV